VDWPQLAYELRHKTRYCRNDRMTGRGEGKTRKKTEAATE